MSLYDEEYKRLSEISDSMSQALLFFIEDRAKISACNLMLGLGSKALEKGDGFVLASCQLAQAIVINLVKDGFITLSESGLASEEELAEREKDKEPRVVPLASGAGNRPPGAYL